MIRTLNLPVELIYCEKGNKGYETYMADDPTGINQVLDKMYGAAFKNPDAELYYEEPSVFFDCAYELAIRLKLQKYPNRYISMKQLDRCIEEALDDGNYEMLWEDYYLVYMMAYALLVLRQDNSSEQIEFLEFFKKYLQNPSNFEGLHLFGDLWNVLDEELEKGYIYNFDISPKPIPANRLGEITDFRFPKPKFEEDFIFLFKLYQTSDEQQKLNDEVMRRNQNVPDRFNFATRISKGEFVHTEPRMIQVPKNVPEELQTYVDIANSETCYWHKLMMYYKSKCEVYEKLDIQAVFMQNLTEMGKGIDEHQQQLLIEQKEKYAKMLDERNEQLKKAIEAIKDMNRRSEAQLKLFESLKKLIGSDDFQPKELIISLTQENIEKLKNGEDVDFQVAESPLTHQPELIQNTVFCQMLEYLIGYAMDIRLVSDENLPSIYTVLEMLIDNEKLAGQLDGDVYRAYSKRIHGLKMEREKLKSEMAEQKHQKELREKTALQGQAITVQGDFVANKHMVDKNYGDQFNLEAGATCQQGATTEQIKSIMKELGKLAPSPISLPNIDKE